MPRGLRAAASRTLVLLMTVGILAGLALASPRDARPVNVAYANSYFWWASYYYTDGAFNNHIHFSANDQQSWTGGEYIALFGVLSGGSWCCSAAGLGDIAYSFSSTYSKAYVWNRSNLPGYHNIDVAGFGTRCTNFADCP
jgi:hypothetical protein